MSEVARFRREQALHEQATQNALFGLAYGVSRHDFIEARTTRGADRILQLLDTGKQEEAMALWETPDWGEGARCNVGENGACQKESSFNSFTQRGQYRNILKRIG